MTYGELLAANRATAGALSAQHARQLFSAEQRALDELVTRQLIAGAAARAGKSTDEYLTEAFAGAEVTDEEARAFYAALPDEERTFEQLEPGIVEHLGEQKRREVALALVARLRAEAGARVALPAPAEAVARFDLAHRPMKGAAGGPLTLVLFEDFQCPYCAEVREPVDALLRAFPEQLRVYYLHYPLSFHDAALGAAIAAQCANAQGKFWPMYEHLYDHQQSLVGTLEGMVPHAEAVGLDMAAFRTCYTGPAAEQLVAEDMEMGQAAGVDGTPAVFVNGIPHDGIPTVSELTMLLGPAGG